MYRGTWINTAAHRGTNFSAVPISSKYHLQARVKITSNNVHKWITSNKYFVKKGYSSSNIEPNQTIWSCGTIIHLDNLLVSSERSRRKNHPTESTSVLRMSIAHMADTNQLIDG